MAVTAVENLTSMSAIVINASVDVAGKLAGPAERLLLSFAAIMLVWTGIRMMIEKNQHDQAIIGDALKLLLQIGIGLAILRNHRELLITLQASVNYLCTEIGANPDTMLTTFYNKFLGDPFAAMSKSIPSIWPSTGSDPSIRPGFLGMLKDIFTNPAAVSTNLFRSIGVALLAFMMIGIGLIAGLIGTMVVVVANSLFGILGALGMICVPFILLPKMDKIFWSWVDGMVYTLACKLTVAGTIAVTGSLQTANTVAYAGKDANGYLVINWEVIIMTLTTAIGMLVLLQATFTVAGILAGTRLSLPPPKLPVPGG